MTRGRNAEAHLLPQPKTDSNNIVLLHNFDQLADINDLCACRLTYTNCRDFCSNLQFSSTGNKFSYYHAYMLIAGVWCYSGIFAIGPLSGWGEYGTEPYGTACCIDWHAPSQNSAAMSYIVCLFFFCYLVPCTVIFLSYTFILLTVWGSRQAVQQHVASQNKIANAHTLIVKVTRLTDRGSTKKCMFPRRIDGWMDDGFCLLLYLLRCPWQFALASWQHGVRTLSWLCGQHLVTQQLFPPWLSPLQLSLPSPPPFTTPSSTWSSSPTSVSSCAGMWRAAEGLWGDVCASRAQPRRHPANRNAMLSDFQTGSRRLAGTVDTVLAPRQSLGTKTASLTTVRRKPRGYLKDPCTMRWWPAGCLTSYRATSCEPKEATGNEV